MRSAVLVLAGFVVGFAVQGFEVWVVAACGVVLGILLACIFFGSEFFVHVYGQAGRSR